MEDVVCEDELKTARDFLLLQSYTDFLNELPPSAAPAAGTTGCHCHLSNTDRVKKKVKLQLRNIHSRIFSTINIYSEGLYIDSEEVCIPFLTLSLALAIIQAKVTL